MGSVNLVPIDISDDKFEVEGGIEFDYTNVTTRILKKVQ